MRELVIVRGGGDIATGTIYKLYQSNFDVLVLETTYPSAIRRNVSFCEAVYNQEQKVEDVTITLANSIEEAKALAVKHFTNPVLWTSEESAIKALCDADGSEWQLLETGPGKVLSGLWKDTGYIEQIPATPWEESPVLA